MLADEGLSGSELPRIHQHVVRKVARGQRGDPALKRRARQEIVRLGLDDVADADKCRMRGDEIDLVLYRLRLKVYPADNASDEWMRVRKFEQPPCFLERLTNLNDDACPEPRGGHLPFRILRQEVAPDGPHRLIDPVVLSRRVAPEVLVGINENHWRLVIGDWLLH